MNLVARTPSFVSSSTSVSSEKKYYGNQDPWSSIAKEDRSGLPDKGTDLFEASDHYYHEQFMESFSSASYSKLDDDRAWSTQEWQTETTTYDRLGRPDETSWRMVRKVRLGHEEILLDGAAQSVRNDEALRDRSGRPDDVNSQEEARPQNFVIGNDETELELFVESRSFVNRVNGQVRKGQKRISSVTGNGEEHSLICGNVFGCNSGISNIHGKEFPKTIVTPLRILQISLQQMFDISAKLVTEQEEISGLETIGWENHSWKYLPLIDNERIINLQRTKVYVFSHSVLCIEKIYQNAQSYEACEEIIGWITSSQSYRKFDGIDGALFCTFRQILSRRLAGHERRQRRRFWFFHTWSNHVGPRAPFRGVSSSCSHASPVPPGVSCPAWYRLVFVDTMANRDHSKSRSPVNPTRRDAGRLSQASTVAAPSQLDALMLAPTPARGDCHSECLS